MNATDQWDLCVCVCVLCVCVLCVCVCVCYVHVIEICNGITFDFYVRLSHTYTHNLR